MDLNVVQDSSTTEVGSYFVATYPPFSVWSKEHVSRAIEALDTPPPTPQNAGTQPPPLGLYVHIPFCRQRCKFCYYRVYTDKNSSDVEDYLRAMVNEVAIYAQRAALRDRPFEFVYFGGGTPSFLSQDQLRRLVDRISEHWAWKSAREITFECEPGTLNKNKFETIKQIGVTRLSLGLEHFDDEVLAINGRAHKSPEVFQSYEWAREVGFDQINLDLIAGMLGDTEDKWKAAIASALQLEPDSVTIYQMELPYNTLFSQEARKSDGPTGVVGGSTKRAWIDYAFRQFEEAGYNVVSAYTVAKPSDGSDFLYRDSVWHGADMVGLGVASFSHIAGMHFQNNDSWSGYVDPLTRGELPIARALPITDHQRLIREVILQLKLGRLDAGYFRRKFDAEILDLFSRAFRSLVDDKFATIEGDDVRLTRDGLLRADGLLPRFYEPQFHNIRYA